MSRDFEHSPPATAAVVLAGGRSSRMGRPKALLPFGGEPLIARVLRSLSPLVGESIVVADADQPLPDLPARLVHDTEPRRGPVMGLAVGLAAARAPRAFVTSCDAPFLNADLILWMLREATGWEVLVPEWEGRLNPLHAVYDTALGERYRLLLEQGLNRPVDLYPRARVRVIRDAEIRRFDPSGRSFTNMNSPEEYERAVAEASGDQSTGGSS